MNKALIVLFCISFIACGKQKSNSVYHVGSLKATKKLGELYGKIALDSLDKSNLYGLGPLEGLKGEITIIDGVSYVSFLNSLGQLKVIENYNVKAPFFVYGKVDEWKPTTMPSHVTDLGSLELYLTSIISTESPFFFRMVGTVAYAKVHIQNQQGERNNKVDFELTDEEVTIIGVYSQSHQRVFTHHDSFIHTHLISKSKKMMGHLDELKIEKVELFLSQ
ncbi:MAG: acetolactate decarboxylase [Bacteroidota bacterium]